MANSMPTEAVVALLEQVQRECPRKKVASLCNQLRKHFSFGSGKDAGNLCDLCYWLYVYGHPELASRCIALTRRLEFNQDFVVWGNIHAMWGLEIRILCAAGRMQEADAIAAEIDRQLMQTHRLNTPESHAKKELARRRRFVIGKENDLGAGYMEASYEAKVEAALADGRASSATAWRLSGLSRLIGDAETGLYPCLNENRARVEETIAAYMAELRQVK